ncbi:MAG TPA: hydroxymethylglutaryl-CoA synthase [Mycobacterium sp.]
MPTVGIDAINAYCGRAFVEVRELFEHRDLDDRRIGNLMMVSKSVPLLCEDIVSFAATAAWPLVAAMSPAERDEIEMLIVATESGIDFSKSASTHVHQLLGLSTRCRLLEVKQACHAGAVALQLAAAWVAARPGSNGRALVIAGDVVVPARDTYRYGEPSQGAGAVAVMVAEQPRIAELEIGVAGYHSYQTDDFCRPRYELDIVDVDLSLLTYIECLLGSYRDYAAKVPGTELVNSFDQLAMHTPFGGMVKGAHRSVLRTLYQMDPTSIAEDFERRLLPSVRYPQQVGNIYSGTTLLAVASAIAHGPERAHRLGVFSYGGGCSSEFFTLRVNDGAAAHLARSEIAAALAGRARLGMAEYDAIVDDLAAIGPGMPDLTVELSRYEEILAGADHAPRHAVLTGINDHHRNYTWLKDETNG